MVFTRYNPLAGNSILSLRLPPGLRHRDDRHRFHAAPRDVGRYIGAGSTCHKSLLRMHESLSRLKGGLSDPLPAMEVLHDLCRCKFCYKGPTGQTMSCSSFPSSLPQTFRVASAPPWSEPRAYNCRNSLARERLALRMKMPKPYRTLHSPLQTTAETRISSSPLVLWCRRLSGVRSKSL